MKRIVLLSLILICVSSQAVFAQNNDIDLGQVVITPFDFLQDTSVNQTPYVSKVYTQKDIQKTKAKNVVEFLQRKADLIVLDYNGTQQQVNVDMSGFMDAGSRNIILLVNGKRMNEVDLSDIDWLSVPLEEVDRIEIIKGAGGVLYGEGASSGVINILTKMPQKEGKIVSRFEGGSYSYHKQSLFATAGKDNCALSTSAVNFSTKGYRENSFYQSKNFGLKVAGDKTPLGDVTFEGAYKREFYGLPSSLTLQNFADGMRRRSTRTPNDVAWRQTKHLATSFIQKKGICTFKESIYYRRRTARTDTPDSTYFDKSKLNEMQGKIEVLFDFDLLGLTHKPIIGAEYVFSSFALDTNSPWATNFTDVNKLSRSFFFQENVSWENLTLSGGYRYQKELYNLDYTQTAGFPTGAIDEDRHHGEENWEAGANYQFNDNVNAYCRYAKAFRSPKGQEIIVTWPALGINTNLSTQYTKTATLGVHTSFENLVFTVEAFVAKTHDQLYYDAILFNNMNYEEVKKRGIDIGTRYVLGPMSLDLNYKYLYAKFGDGNLQGNRLFFTPPHHAVVNLQYKPLDELTFNLIGTYTSKYYALNDLRNEAPPADSVTVWDTRAAYQWKKMRLFMGINNVFDKKYFGAVLYSNGNQNKTVHPAPKRNFFGGVELRWEL